MWPKAFWNFLKKKPPRILTAAFTEVTKYERIVGRCFTDLKSNSAMYFAVVPDKYLSFLYTMDGI
jgi:hypothetical protein